MMRPLFVAGVLGMSLLVAAAGFGRPAESAASPMISSPDTIDTDTTTGRVVEPGAPGEPTRVLVEGRSVEAPRIVQPSAPGEPSRVLRSGDAQPTRIVRPGAPGAPSRVQRVQRTLRQGEPTYTDADVAFMQKMILHHAQALQMTALVEERASRDAIRQLAERIERSQRDEIATMMQWLEERDEEGPALPPDVASRIDGAQAGHTGHDHSGMAGMLSPDELDELAAAEGDAFDRLFLEFMIFHHEGAITMVDELFATPGSGQDTDIFTFASHVEADQQIEIERMARMLQAY